MATKIKVESVGFVLRTCRRSPPKKLHCCPVAEEKRSSKNGCSNHRAVKVKHLAWSRFKVIP